LSLILYRLGVALLEPFTPAILKGRAKRGKEDGVRLRERLGHASVARPQEPLVWIHAVSVGESLSVLPLIARLREQTPRTTVLVTSGTVTSASLLAQRLPAGAIHQYAPLDTPGASRRFLDHWRPDVAIFVESEFWPNLILGAMARGARLVLMSARVTEKTARGWRRARGMATAVLRAFDLILPQDRATEQRLGRFGVKSAGRLNLKYIGEPLACDEAELARLRGEIGDRGVVLAASTHLGEDAHIALAFEQVTMTPAPLLIIAPRHPERGNEVVEWLRQFSDGAAQRSAGEPITSNTRAYVADTLGEMGLWYRLATVVVMGGSFVPGIGGHNPLEPARLGVPVITGNDIFNFADVYAEMLAGQNGALLGEPQADLLRHIQELLSNPAWAQRIGEAGRAFAASKSAALDEAWAELEPLLP
jgi:3-deoxy-D-manno-octulosonic-acid transferase